MLGDRFSYRTTGFVLRVHIMFQTNTRAPIDMNRETARQFVIALSVTMTTACIVTQIICMCDPEFAFSKQDSVVSSLHCSARTDTFITLEWTKPVFPARKYAVLISAVNSDKNDNREIDTDAWTDTLMTVDNLTPGQLYTFAVTSVIDWDDEGERRLSSMSIQAGTMPSAPGPVDLRKSHVNNERVQIVWHASPGFVDHYIVLLKDCKRNVLETKLATKPFVSLDNPQGNTVYEVEIVAVKDGDRSGPVFEEIHAKASDSVVSSLHCSARTDTFITLEWTKPVFPARKYAVLISAVNSDKNDNREIDTDAWTDTLMTVDNLTPGQLYTFAVTSVIDWYDEGERRLSSMSIQAGTMPSSPGPVRKSHVNNERVQIVWHASPGFVDHYIVLLKDCKRNVLERKLATKPFVSLDNPQGNTVYEVEIVAVKDGDRSGPVFEEIHAKESDLKVQNLRDTKQDITSITLEWTRPVYSIAVSYKVHWSPLQSDQYHIREVDTGAVSLVIGGLMPGEVYKVWVTSVVRTPCGEDEFHSDQIKVSTVPNIPGEIDKRKSTITSTYMDLHWKAPPGKVDTYLIRLDGPSSGPDVFSVGPSVLIENLETNTNYEIQIYAISGSARSEPRIEIIKTNGIQSKRAEFTVAGIGKGTLAATWMSSYGGTVASGGFFSLLQSAGVVGLTVTAKAAIIASGMALGCIVEVV